MHVVRAKMFRKVIPLQTLPWPKLYEANWMDLTQSGIPTTKFLIRYHEERGDKILVFSDDVFAFEVVLL